MRTWLVAVSGAGLLGAAPPPDASAPASTSSATRVTDVVVTARRPTRVGAVTVIATNWCPEPDPVRHPADRAPRVADTWPRQGGQAAPGYVLVRVTFDAPMSCYSEVTVDGGEADPCSPSGTWELPARRSWIMSCRLQPSTRYRIAFRKSEGAGFVGLSGRTADAYELAFTTTSGPPTPSLQQAQAADPGPPGATRSAAYVTCVDTGRPPAARDCQHQVFGRTTP